TAARSFFKARPRQRWRMRTSFGRCADDGPTGPTLPVACMKRWRTFTVLLCASAAATVAWGGHELPIYPSFYPHEIDIQTLAPEQAAAALGDAKVHAYVGRGAGFPAAPPDTIGTVESLGSFVLVRVNPQSSLAHDETSMCRSTKSVMRDVGQGGGVVLN